MLDQYSNEWGMVDPYNPTEEELRTWANTPGAWEPVEDFDIMIVEDHNYELIYELAGSSECPNKQYFVHCLYLMVGSIYQCSYDSEPIRKLIDRAATASDNQLQQWSRESNDLLLHPETYKYDLWCGRELSNQNRLEVD